MRRPSSLALLVLALLWLSSGGCTRSTGSVGSSQQDSLGSAGDAGDAAPDAANGTPDLGSEADRTAALDVASDASDEDELLGEDLLGPDLEGSDIAPLGKGGLLEGQEESELEQGPTKLLVPKVSLVSAPRWRLVWRDEFDGPQPEDDPACFSRTPQCLYDVASGPRNCPPEASARLQNLNKCNWVVWNFYNYMNGDEADDDGTNAFRYDQLSLEQGMLVLWAHSQPGPYDCGRLVADPLEWDQLNQTTQCPFLSGGVSTQTSGDPSGGLNESVVPGFNQLYGRFEIRARLSDGPGTWPAIWMMHQTWDYGWPYDGEIDIMELWADSSKKVTGAFHGGDFPDKVHLVDRHPWSATSDYYPQSDRKQTWHKDFHVFAVEWDPQEIRFYVDKWLIGTTENGKPMKDKKSGKTYALKTPTHPFYLLLNLTIAPNLGTWLQNLFNDYRPDPDDFTPQRMEIDYVRVYEVCQAGDSDCVENTLNPSCPNPCASVGFFNGYGCLLGAAPDGFKVQLLDGAFYYEQKWLGSIFDPKECRPEHPYVDGKGCYLAAVPQGRSGFVVNQDGQSRYYLQATCNPLEGIANCTTPCPQIGNWDGANCYITSAPSGTTPFLYQNGFYIDASNGTCPLAGSFDGAHCLISSAPSGTSPFIYQNGFYVKGSCGPLPYEDATGL